MASRSEQLGLEGQLARYVRQKDTHITKLIQFYAKLLDTGNGDDLLLRVTLGSLIEQCKEEMRCG